MKVWLLQRAEPTPHDNDGAQRKLRTGLMAEFFQAAGHEVIWFTSTFDHYNRRQRFDETTRTEVMPGFDIVYLKGPGYRRNISFQRLQDERVLAEEFARYARTLPKPDVILSSLPSVTIAREASKYAGKRGIPHVCDVRDLWPDVFLDVLPSALRPIAAPVLHPLRRSLGKVVDASTAVTGLTDQYIQWALDQGTRAKTAEDRPLLMAYMPQESIELSSFEKEAMKKKFEIVDGELNVVFVGTIGPMMSLDPVLDAARKLSEKNDPVKIRLCGHGSDFERVRTQAATIKTIDCPGWINAREIRYLLEESDVGLLPYKEIDTFRWSIPNKFGEYLAGSLVLVGNLAESAMGQMITDTRSGFIYSDDSERLADTLEWLEQDRGELARVRSNARQLYEERFHGPRVFTDFVARIENVVANAAA
ncbi:Glycosyltransferase involved in cell wall bisynthesis [Altererythrobacter xiamenensis]|uniref:Glycosyltransferase involved in cell wall bisynthesis n=1 Tax=Altererythrobacter xiamenensis TaxID=1316679 RepID=A0A1Y6F8N3_9SPHN|nr:glycosyltransferase [Altererythrobacter xiamenensis]SMQ69082.1 Glycosyltransferase involved in cell wall bisynthesis [Altererythrobacter xiamenensis]